MQDVYGPELEIPNDEEDDRLEHIALYVVRLMCRRFLLTPCRLKLRGKGAPKKKSGPPG